MLYAWGDENYKILFGKFEGKTPLGKVRHRYEDNIKVVKIIGHRCRLDSCDSE
jgi:hypothetical protein